MFGFLNFFSVTQLLFIFARKIYIITVKMSTSWTSLFAKVPNSVGVFSGKNKNIIF